MTTHLATLQDVDALDARLRSVDRIPIDTEFHAERRYRPRLYLIQFLLDDHAWLVDPLVDGLVAALGPALRSCTWLVHGGEQDMRLLRRALGGLPDAVWDTQIAAALCGHRFPERYDVLVKHHLGVAVDKGATLSDWSKRPLSDEQLMYAAEDVRRLPALWASLEAQLDALGRRQLALDACQHARDVASAPRDPDTAWRDIPGHPTLTPQAAAVLAELAAWRELEARDANQPPHALVHNAILLDLARKQPASIRALRQNRRVPRGVTNRHGDALVERVQRAAKRPAWAWPKLVERGGADDAAVQVLRAVVATVGLDAQWSPRLVAPDRLLEDVVLAAPPDRESLAAVLGPWRDALCGDALWDAWSGARAPRLRRGRPTFAD